jgi:site-specific recombinase XerD
MGNVKSEPDQLTLFDLGVDLKRLREQQARLLARDAAVNTKKAYSVAWRRFLDWCGASGRSPMPASEETVCLYLTYLLEERNVSVNTAALVKSALVAMHRTAGHVLAINGGVSALLSGARRARAGEQRSKAKEALTVEQLRRMLAKLDGCDLQSVRDRAILAVGFASGMRRSELVGLDFGDVEFKPQGVLLHIRKSKTDQEGRGRDVGLMAQKGKGRDLCPVRALRAWVKLRGKKPGALFWSMTNSRPEWRLRGPVICTIVQAAVGRIGLDAAKYGAHSLRAGLVTSCLAAGASELAVMQRTGHKNVSTLQRYVRPATAFAFDPLSLALKRGA